MNAQQAAVWACQKRKIVLTLLDEIGNSWRATLKFDCGHAVQQDFKYPGFSLENLRTTARQLEETKARRWIAAAKAAGQAPCIACGPAAPSAA